MSGGTLNYPTANGQSAEPVLGYGGNLRVTEGQPIPLISETPLVGSAPTAKKDLDAGSSQFVAGFRVTVGAGDDTVASNRLANVFPSTVQGALESAVVVLPSTAVSRVDVVGMGSATAGGVMAHDGTAANALAQMTTFEFSTPVNRVVVSCSSSWNSGREAQITVEGYYNA